jgi:transmembrane sensor
MNTLLQRARRRYLDRKIRRRALAWVLRFDQSEEQPMTEIERARFEGWFATDPRHQWAFRTCWVNCAYLAALKDEIRLGNGTQGKSASRLLREPPRLLVYGPISATLLAFAVVGGLGLNKLGEVVYATRTGEFRHVTLPDGSELQLSTRTQVRWERCAAIRCVTLVAGEAYFTVRRDMTRAFVVHVGIDDAAIRVTGTQFDVTRHQTEVDVTVAEGTVLVSGSSNGHPWTRKLHANEQMGLSDTGVVTEVHHVSASEATSWKEGVLEINDSLPAVICRLSEYIEAPVSYDPRVADFGIQARLDLSDVPRTLTKLPASAPIVVERIGNSYVVRLRTPPDSGVTPVPCH